MVVLTAVGGTMEYFCHRHDCLFFNASGPLLKCSHAACIYEKIMKPLLQLCCFTKEFIWILGPLKSVVLVFRAFL